MLRYASHPKKISVPFLLYFHEIVSKTQPPSLPKNLFLNNKRTDLRKILCLDYKLKYSDNKRSEPKLFYSEGDFYQNFRDLDPKNDSIFFEALEEEEDQ